MAQMIGGKIFERSDSRRDEREENLLSYEDIYVDISITLVRSVCSFETASAAQTSGDRTCLEDESASVRAMVMRSIKQTFTSR